MLPSIRRTSAWTQLGKVALGDKGGTNGAPRDSDHFFLKEKVPGTPDYRISKKYHEILGDKPKELDIILPFATMDETIRDRAVMYGSNKLRQCFTDDGVRAERRRKVGDKMEWYELACPAEKCEFRIDKKCKEKAIFTFMVPALGIGTFHMDFGSRVGAAKIYAALSMIEAVCQQQQRPNGMRSIRCKLTRDATAFDVSGRRIIKFIPTLQIDFASLMQTDKLLLGPLMGQDVAAIEGPVRAISAAEADAVDADVDEVVG